MKRLAILLFCTSTFASPIDCKDEVCTVDKSALDAMLVSRQRAIMERNMAMDAYRTIRAQLGIECWMKS